jgi:DNA-binding NtrC family response regulator
MARVRADAVIGNTLFAAAVDAFKARLLAETLAANGGNRTRTARALGLQRTYLCRLLRYYCPDVAPGQMGKAA